MDIFKKRFLFSDEKRGGRTPFPTLKSSDSFPTSPFQQSSAHFGLLPPIPTKQLSYLNSLSWILYNSQFQMSRDLKPIVRSSDMSEENRTIVVQLAQDLMNAYSVLEGNEYDIARGVRIELFKEFQSLGIQQQENGWSVAVGKNFVVSTDVKRGWYAHIYLKQSISMLVWKIK